MLRVAIVEDDSACAEQLRGYVLRYFRERGEAVNAALFPDGLDIAEDYRPVWDIILLDIEMPHLDGMSAARRIRQTDPAVVIVFITNLAQYAIHGYEVGALDFVLKPVTYAQLSMKLRRAVETAKLQARHYLAITADGVQQKLVTESIRYIEVINHQLHVHTDDREYASPGSLQSAEKQLAGLPFARCSNSFLVNLRAVTAVHKDKVFLGEVELPITRTRRQMFLQRLSDYMGGGFL